MGSIRARSKEVIEPSRTPFLFQRTWIFRNTDRPLIWTQKLAWWRFQREHSFGKIVGKKMVIFSQKKKRNAGEKRYGWLFKHDNNYWNLCSPVQLVLLYLPSHWFSSLLGELGITVPFNKETEAPRSWATCSKSRVTESQVFSVAPRHHGTGHLVDIGSGLLPGAPEPGQGPMAVKRRKIFGSKEEVLSE